MIDWEQQGYEVVGAAGDGVEAMETLSQSIGQAKRQHIFIVFEQNQRTGGVPVRRYGDTEPDQRLLHLPDRPLAKAAKDMISQSNTAAVRPVNKSRLITGIIRWTLTALICFVILFPMWWIFIPSITPSDELYTSPIHHIPLHPTFENFARAVTDMGIMAGGVKE